MSKYRVPIALLLLGIVSGVGGMINMLGGPYSLAYSLLGLSLVSLVLSVVMAAVHVSRGRSPGDVEVPDRIRRKPGEQNG